jgi:hypothetical protein
LIKVLSTLSLVCRGKGVRGVIEVWELKEKGLGLGFGVQFRVWSTKDIEAVRGSNADNSCTTRRIPFRVQGSCMPFRV